MKIKAWSPAQLGKTPLLLFLYVRVSMGRDVMDSPKMQVRQGEIASELRNARIKQVVDDLDESGQEFGHRKVMWMIEEIRKGNANGIIVLETSRWGRNLTESRQYVAELYKAGGVLVSSTQPIDPTTADGLMIMNHFMNMDEHYGNKIGEGWVRAHNNRKAKKRPHHGREVFGYRRCPDCRRNERNKRAYDYCKECKGVLQVDPAVKSFYRDAFKRYNRGESMNSITTIGRSLGIRTSQGNLITERSLRGSMDTGFAAGFIRVNSDSSAGRTAGPWEWRQWIRGEHKRIISLGDWLRYVKRREQQRDPEQRRRDPAYALSTLMRCGCDPSEESRCMAAMHANPSKKPNESTFECGNRQNQGGCPGVSITIHRAEKLVLDWVAARATGQEWAEIEVRRSAQAKHDTSELRKLETAEKKTLKQLEDLVDALLDGTFTKEQVKKRQTQLQAELSVTRSRLALLQESVASNSAPPAHAFADYLKLWPRLELLERQKSLAQIIDHVVVHPTPRGTPSRIEIVPRWAPLADRLDARRGKNWDRIRAARLLAA